MVYYDLDEGPRGLWLSQERSVGIDDVVSVRHWSHGRFGRARTVPGSRGHVVDTAIAQNAKGRLAVSWFDSRRDAVRVSTSRTGRRWSHARTLGHFDGLPSTLAIDLGREGRGVVAVDQGTRSHPVLVARFR
jgi:hypothetical protein